jgi:oligosaccharyltransferase complex subunit beta
MSHGIDSDEISTNIGEQLTLVSGYQSLNNHRALFTGSMAMCSDEVFSWHASDNQRFCEEMLDWVMQESGVLRVTDIKHQKEGTEHSGVNPENYFIEDKIEYFATFEQKTKG